MGLSTESRAGPKRQSRPDQRREVERLMLSTVPSVCQRDRRESSEVRPDDVASVSLEPGASAASEIRSPSIPSGAGPARKDGPASPDRRDQLRRVFSNTGDALYRFILVRVGGERDAADELLQQTCHEAARSSRVPPGDAECEAWLRGVARNLIRRHWRRMKRRNGHVPIEDATLSQHLVESMESQPLPVEALGRAEAAQQLLLAVTSLPAADQQLVFAFYFEGRSQADIAREMGVSAKSVETRLYRVRSRLRAILRDIERT